MSKVNDKSGEATIPFGDKKPAKDVLSVEEVLDQYNDKIVGETLLKLARKRFKKACEKHDIKEFRCTAINPRTVEGLIQLTAAVNSGDYKDQN